MDAFCRHIHSRTLRFECRYDGRLSLVWNDRSVVIRGVVANYLASQARDPGIDSHQHQKDS